MDITFDLGIKMLRNQIVDVHADRLLLWLLLLSRVSRLVSARCVWFVFSKLDHNPEISVYPFDVVNVGEMHACSFRPASAHSRQQQARMCNTSVDLHYHHHTTTTKHGQLQPRTHSINSILHFVIPPSPFTLTLSVCVVVCLAAACCC